MNNAMNRDHIINCGDVSAQYRRPTNYELFPIYAPTRITISARLNLSIPVDVYCGMGFLGDRGSRNVSRDNYLFELASHPALR